MSQEEFPREDELEGRQDAALYPVGRVLRTTFDAENHDSLGTDLTGLMLELAHIDPDAASLPRGMVPPVSPALPAAEPVAPVPEVGSPPTPVAATASWWQGFVAWWRLLLGRPAH